MKFYKKATIGGQGSDKSMEEAVAGLAHTLLADKAPKLMEPGRELGFQMIEKTDDDSRAAGVVGFNLNGIRAFVPIICLNGEIKGHEMIYLPNQDAFFPLKDAWLNEIMGNKPLLLGDAVNKSFQRDQGSTQPDLSVFSSPPKFASYGYDPKSINLIKLACHTSGCSMSKIGQAFKAAVADHFKLCDIRDYFCYCSNSGIRKFANYVNGTATIKKAFYELYPDVDFEKILASRHAEKRAFKLLDKPLDPKWRDKLFQREPKKAGYVSIISYSTTLMSGPPTDLSAAEKERLASKGYLVLDNRKDSETATIVSEPVSLVNPSVAGIFSVIQKDGKFKDMVVIPYKTIDAKFWSDGDGNDQYVFIGEPSEHTSLQSVKRDRVFAKPHHELKDFESWFKKLKTCKSEIDGNGDNVAFINDKGVCYGTFYFHSSIGPDNVIIGSKLASKLEYRSNKLWIPTDCRYFSVKLEYETKDDLGIPELLWCKQEKEASHIRLAASNHSCIINGKSYPTRFDGLCSLIKDYNLKEADANWMFKQADAAYSTSHTIDVRVKKAIDESLLNPNSSMTFPEAEETTDNIFGRSLPTTQGGIELVQDPTQRISEVSNEDRLAPENDYPAMTSPAADNATVRQALQNGQSEIFNVSMLKQLLSGSSLSSQIDEDIPKLVRSMNQWGRNLFRFYWKGDQFKELYGPQELPELENNLRKLFELSGDIILLLKHKLQRDDTYGGLTSINLNAEN